MKILISMFAINFVESKLFLCGILSDFKYSLNLNSSKISGEMFLSCHVFPEIHNIDSNSQ